jgi:hypothetical protein
MSYLLFAGPDRAGQAGTYEKRVPGTSAVAACARNQDIDIIAMGDRPTWAC